VTRRAEVHLVEGEQPLPVVGDRLHHGPLLELRPAGRDRGQQRGAVLDRMAYEHPRVDHRLRVEADHRLPGQVLRDVGDQAVLTDHP
jgi:hypothetical protein